MILIRVCEERVSAKGDAENTEERRDTTGCVHSGKEWKESKTALKSCPWPVTMERMR